MPVYFSQVFVSEILVNTGKQILGAEAQRGNLHFSTMIGVVVTWVNKFIKTFQKYT